MRIQSLEVHPVSVDRIYKTRVAPAGGHGEGKAGSQYLILELKTDTGLSGIGEISDLEAGWHAPSPEVLKALFSDMLLGADVLQRIRVMNAVSEKISEGTHPELRRLMTAAVEMALFDLAGKHYGAPVCEFLGGRCRDRVAISWVAYIRGADVLEDEIAEKVAQGFRAFKLKVGEDFEQDCQRVRMLRHIAGPDAHVRVDASGAWDVEEAIENLRLLAELGVDAVETPIGAAARGIAKDHPEQVNEAAGDVAAALFRVRRAVPVEVIEHVSDFDDAFAVALIAHRAVDVFNVVPGQAGGLARAQRLVHLAQTGGVRALLGSTVELGPGTAAALHLAAACPAVCVASDLVGPGLLTGDVVSPRLRYEDGMLRVPMGAGLGVVLDRETLAAHRTRE